MRARYRATRSRTLRLNARLARCCHSVVRGTRLLAGALDPAAAEGAVQIDKAGEALQARRDESELGVVERGLRDEHVQIRVRAVPIAEVRKLQLAPLRRGEALLGSELLVERAARGESVRHLAEGGLNGLFVLRDADVLLDLRDIEVRPQRATFEDRDRDRR